MIKFFRKIRQKMLTENRIGKYLIYAIGEIILVVMGIFIAIQINELYENRKHVKTIKTIAGHLIENLLSDSLYIASWKGNVRDDRQYMQALETRINSANATIDTLIQIASREYNPAVNTVDFLNQSAFKTMVSTGEINLFDKYLIESLYQVYTYQERAEERSNTTFDTYLTAIDNYKSKYFFRESDIAQKSPLHRQVWNNIDEEDFITSFSFMLSNKLLLYNQVDGTMKRVEQNINLLLPKLRALVD